MTENKKLEADKNLINKLFALNPLDWSRRDDGSLVYLNQAGQKFIVTAAELERLTDAYLEKETHLKKHGLNPSKKIRAELIDKPAGVPPASQVVAMPSKPASGEAGADAHSGVVSTQSRNGPPAGGSDAPTPASEQSA